MNAPGLVDTPTGRVLAYVRDMHEWEHSCRRDARRALGVGASPVETKRFCLERRNKVLAEHCDCNPDNLGLSIGVPPEYSPRGCRVVDAFTGDEGEQAAAQVLVMYEDRKDKLRFGREYRFTLRRHVKTWKISKVERKLPSEHSFAEVPLG